MQSMSFIIVTRNPGGGGLVIINDSRDGSEWEVPVEFETEAKAKAVADEQVLCKAWWYEILEVSV